MTRLAIGTRKGAFFLKDGRLTDPVLLGNDVHHVVGRGKTLLMAARSGHLGPTLHCSADGGRTWKESKRPPAFPKRKNGRSDFRFCTRPIPVRNTGPLICATPASNVSNFVSVRYLSKRAAPYRISSLAGV